MSETLHRITKIKKIILWSVIIGGIIALFIPTLVYGQNIPVEDVCAASQSCLKGTDSLAGGTSRDSVVKILLNIARFLTFVGAAVAVLVGVWAGITIMTSNGDSKKYENGLNTLRYAVIGLVITILAYTVVSIITGIISTTDLSETTSFFIDLLTLA